MDGFSGYEGLTQVSDDKTIVRVECGAEEEVASALERARIGAGVMTGAST